MNKQIINTIKFFSEKIYVILFVIIIGVGLIFSVLILTNILNKSSIDINEKNINSITFDQPTINRLNNLNSSDSNTTDVSTLPGRINPFAE